MIGRLVGAALESHDNMGLFEAALQTALAPGVARLRKDRLGRSGDDAGKTLGHILDDALVLDRAGGAHHHGAAEIMAVEIVADTVAVEAGDSLRRAENRAPEGLFGECDGVEEIENEIVRRIVDGADLLQDDAFLALQFVAVETCCR